MQKRGDVRTSLLHREAAAVEPDLKQLSVLGPELRELPEHDAIVLLLGDAGVFCRRPRIINAEIRVAGRAVVQSRTDAVPAARPDEIAHDIGGAAAEGRISDAEIMDRGRPEREAGAVLDDQNDVFCAHGSGGGNPLIRIQLRRVEHGERGMIVEIRTEIVRYKALKIQMNDGAELAVRPFDMPFCREYHSFTFLQ